MRTVIFTLFALLILSCNSNSKGDNDIDSSLIQEKNSISNDLLNYNVDSLKKYSYFIYGKYPSDILEAGSGFFIRLHKKLYFISALHLFSGITIDNKRIPNYPDIITVRINNDLNKYLFNINISEIKRKSKFIPFYLSPDVYVYAVNISNIPKNLTIYSIEKFINPDINCNEIKNVIICGYPHINTHDSMVILTANPEISKETIFGNYCNKMHFESFNAYDSINYSISNHIVTGGGGMSGSPAYFIYKNKIIFGGLVFGGSPVFILVIRPEHVLDKLH